MKDGFVRVAVGTPEIHVADCEFNAKSIISLMNEAKEKQVKVLALPELCITGATAQDLFWHDALLNGAKDALEEICAASEGSDLVTVVGLPFQHRGRLFNCAAVVQDGRVIGLAPQTNVSGAKKTWFASFESEAEILWQDPLQDVTFGGDMIFECNELDGLRFAVVFGDDLSAADSEAARFAQAGATVIINCAADPELVGQADYRRMMAKSQSSRLTCAYLYANAGRGESTQDMVYSGHSLIAECGEILAESKPYTTGLTVTEIDIQKIEADRRRANCLGGLSEREFMPFELDVDDTPISRFIDPMPFVPADPAVREGRCEEILNIQAQGLMQRLRHTHCKTAVIGVSGGLDSTLALLVASRAFRLLGLPSEGIMAITMPCFGTTKRTRSNAEVLAECLGMSFREVSIAKAVTQHFEDIGQSLDDHSVTFENGQARERTQVLMDIANKCGGMVIGTGDLSELALGWATYNGDHMSMYGVNGDVPKMLVRYLVRHEAEHADSEALKNVLLDILDTPVSPELLPPKDGDIAQKTEDLVGPYELHDFFLYHLLRRSCTPEKVLRLAKIAFEGRYDEETIVKWLKTFCRRFFNQQFKRSCLPDGPKVGTVGVSPRGDLRMPSDAVSALWQKL